MRRAKLCVVLLALGMLGMVCLPGFCADYTQHEDFGVKKPGDVVSFTVTPPGTVLSGGVNSPGGFVWFGGPASWTGTIPTNFAGVHNGSFSGTYQPPGEGPGPSRIYTWEADTKAVVYKLKHQTYAPVPANRLRTKLGIGEQVQCWIEPTISVNWSVSGGGSVYYNQGNWTIFTASKSPSTSTIRAQGGDINFTVTFNVVAPNGMTSILSSDGSLGSPGTNNIGAISYFEVCVLPNDVSFYWAKFRENIPSQVFTWPDGTIKTLSAKFDEWPVNYDNTQIDTCNNGLDPVIRLFNGMNYVDYTFTVRVPEEYKNEAGNWISWFPEETHPCEYRGADLKARTILNASDTAIGGWMGPWE